MLRLLTQNPNLYCSDKNKSRELKKNNTEMTKVFKRLAMFTIVTVAVGAAVLTSCGKDDEVINDVPAMEMKLADPPKDTIFAHRGGIITLYWHREYPVIGEPFELRCRVGTTPYGICGVVIVISTSGEDDIHAATWLDGNGIIKSMEIESANMSSDVKDSFLELVEKGTITFEENCPITDPELLAVSKTDHIPAGTYPIKLEKDNFVITISE